MGVLMDGDGASVEGANVGINNSVGAGVGGKEQLQSTARVALYPGHGSLNPAALAVLGAV